MAVYPIEESRTTSTCDDDGSASTDTDLINGKVVGSRETVEVTNKGVSLAAVDTCWASRQEKQQEKPQRRLEGSLTPR